MEEIWKDIEGYEGLYQVSNLGNIKSLKYGKERILKQATRKDGYKTFALSMHSIEKSFRVHRVVAQAFIPNPNNYEEVNHKDEDKTNNCVWNLEWCDRKYNMNYGTRPDRCAYKVYQYDLDGNFIKIWKSIREIERQLNIPRTSLKQWCVNKKQGCGFIWSYKSLSTEEVLQIANRPHGLSKAVLQYDLSGNFIKEFPNITEARKLYGSHICDCCVGKRKTAGGFRWKYKNDTDELLENM